MSLDIRPNPSATGSVTGGLEYKGSYNATTNSPNLTSSLKGDFYIVSVGGTLAGVTLDVGDHIVFNQDASSPITSAMFDKIDNTDAVASVNGQTGVVSLDTDNISEGSSNLYYTNARFDTQLGTKTTDNLTEGSSNLYYTNARFDTQLGTKTTDNLTEGSSNLYYTNARFDTQLGTKDTDDISEGSSNLYFTNTRADARIGAANMTDLNDVNYTAGAGIDGKFLKYVNANSRWEAADAPADAVSSVNTQTGAVVLDTDDISEGTSNLYYTNARFDTQLGTKTTDNLTEGSSNLYYTNARFDTQLGTKTTDNLTEGSSNLYYTNARFDTQLGTKDTGDLSEGSNLYYTNARADARIGAANLTDLNDVNYTAGAAINDYVLTYVHANTRWEAKEATGGGGSALPPEVKETTTTTPVSVSLTPSDSNSYTDLEVMYLVNNSSTAVELDLPTASGNEGKKIHIKRTGTADVTIDPNGTEQIDNGGAGTAFVLTSQYQSVSLISNGTNWFIF